MSDRPASSRERSLADRIDQQKAHPLAWQTVAKRAAVVLVAGVSIYLVFPTITEVFASWPRLSTLDPKWFGLAVAAEIGHFVCTLSKPGRRRISRRHPDLFLDPCDQFRSNVSV